MLRQAGIHARKVRMYSTRLAAPLRRPATPEPAHHATATPTGAPPGAVPAHISTLLYTHPPTAPPKPHILSCLVSDEPGILSRISGIFASRGFNIDSLVVSQTDRPNLSRMTIAIRGGETVVQQVRRQLEDLVPVWGVLDYSSTRLIQREVALLRVALPEDPVAQMQQRESVTSLARLFDAKVLDLTSQFIMVELCAKPERIDAFMALCRPMGLMEAVRSGVMAMPRAPLEDDAKEDAKEEEHGAVDATMLPPG